MRQFDAAPEIEPIVWRLYTCGPRTEHKATGAPCTQGCLALWNMRKPGPTEARRGSPLAFAECELIGRLGCKEMLLETDLRESPEIISQDSEGFCKAAV